jgi:hypothetical protein
MEDISLRQVLDVIADFDEFGGATPSLVAWELSVEEQRVAPAWDQAVAEGLLRRAGRDSLDGERLWRLTAGGWAARDGFLGVVEGRECGAKGDRYALWTSRRVERA